MKVSEIRKLESKEILEKVKESKKELLNLRIKNATGALDKPSKLREIKKEIARMLTVLNERKMDSTAGGNK